MSSHSICHSPVSLAVAIYIYSSTCSSAISLSKNLARHLFSTGLLKIRKILGYSPASHHILTCAPLELTCARLLPQGCTNSLNTTDMHPHRTAGICHTRTLVSQDQHQRHSEERRLYASARARESTARGVSKPALLTACAVYLRAPSNSIALRSILNSLIHTQLARPMMLTAALHHRLGHDLIDFDVFS